MMPTSESSVFRTIPTTLNVFNFVHSFKATPPQDQQFLNGDLGSKPHPLFM